MLFHPEQFLHLRDKKLKKQPNNKVPAAAAVPLLRLILGALEQFVKAQNENIEFNLIKNLFKSNSVGKITLYFKKLHTKLIDTTSL
jgi:hypothetical protein